MRIRDSFLNQEPTFETRLLYAMYTSNYDYNSEEKFGYRDGAKFVLNSYKPLEELETYIQEYEVTNKPLDNYDKSYLLAIKDYIKQEQESVTNE